MCYLLEEADWVDKNRAKLIQSVAPVMPIVDELFQRRFVHYELYCNIQVARTSQDQMRLLTKAFISGGVKAKSAFYRLLQKHRPDICEAENFIKEIIKKHKERLREKFRYVLEGTADKCYDAKSLDKIYTELHIIQGDCKQLNEEHEIWEIEEKSRTQTIEGCKINCNDIFQTADKMLPEQDRGEGRIRTVMTKGIAGIGKTVSVKKFILDWAEERANQDLEFIFVLPFKELNLVKDDQLSLQTLLRDFHPELSNIPDPQMFVNRKVLFIFDGLDESQLKLDFSRTKMVTDINKESSVDILLTNLIRKDLLPSALLWITSRPGAVQRIPSEHINQWTEVRGFNDPQKEEYFRKRVEDKKVAERIINHITMSRSLYIMCHIPVFCWIAAKVLEHLLSKSDNTQDKSSTIETPTTLTEMYTHFLLIQTQLADVKYQNNRQNDPVRILKSSKEFILKLGRMAFEHLERSSIMFYEDDLIKYDIDIQKAGVYCGLCTEIFKEESVLYEKKLYCFVHLTVQEFFAALFVYHSYASKKIDSLSLKTFLLIGSEEELKSILDVDPVDLPLEELIEISIGNSTQRKSGELDMFLRFLIGMSLASTQNLLKGLIQQTEDHSQVVEEIKTILIEIDLDACSPERCLNLVHCLIELKDSSLHNAIQEYLKPNHGVETELSPVYCSALADTILMSTTPLEEFNLRKYRPSPKGVSRLLPAVRNSRKAMLSHNYLGEAGCGMLATALSSNPSPLRELDLSYNDLQDSGVKQLCGGLMSPHCQLKTLGLSSCKVTGDGCASLASALRSDVCNLRELDLSFNHPADQGVKLLTERLEDSSCSLEKLNVEHNEECWIDLKLLRQYACDLTLDPNTASRNIILLEENKKAQHVAEEQTYPDHPDRFESRIVMCSEGLTGRHFWEVECSSAYQVGVAYKSIPKTDSGEFPLGKDETCWALSLTPAGGFCHNGSCIHFHSKLAAVSKLGVYLDWPAGILSFYEIDSYTMTHLYTVHTVFTEPLYAAFCVDCPNTVSLCKIK
ncbi:NLR family CARD domain-containing protein 3-like [Diretmus argenteus]